jgi:hypothetical protein
VAMDFAHRFMVTNQPHTTPLWRTSSVTTAESNTGDDATMGSIAHSFPTWSSVPRRPNSEGPSSRLDASGLRCTSPAPV